MSNEQTPAIHKAGFGTTEMARRDETAEAAVAATARAMVEARYVMALRQPRDHDEVRQRLMVECKRPGFAEVARYRKPIGRDFLEGPSIRFAEAAIRCMRNVSVDVNVIYDDPDKQIVAVTVTDLEANIPFSDQTTLRKTVERRSSKGRDVVGERQNSYGDTVYVVRATEDEFLNKQRAAVSKLMRTCALRVIPGDLIDEAMAQVLATQAAVDKEDPGAARARMADAFFTIGVKVPELKEFLGCDLDAASAEQMLDLKGIFRSIRDGEATWRSVMEARSGDEATDAPDGGAKAAAEKAAADLTDKIAKSETVEALQALAAPIKKVAKTYRAGLTTLFEARMADLKKAAAANDEIDVPAYDEEEPKS